MLPKPTKQNRTYFFVNLRCALCVAERDCGDVLQYWHLDRAVPAVQQGHQRPRLHRSVRDRPTNLAQTGSFRQHFASIVSGDVFWRGVSGTFSCTTQLLSHLPLCGLCEWLRCDGFGFLLRHCTFLYVFFFFFDDSEQNIRLSCGYRIDFTWFQHLRLSHNNIYTPSTTY